jgi:hypothetical protein
MLNHCAALTHTARTPSLATMSARSTSSLAGALERVSLDGCTSSTSGKSPPHQATLLGIPRELRNTIFGHVYGLFDASGGQVDMMICPEKIPKIGVQYSQAPPSKDPVLVCRQLYTEMKSMQAEAFRQYWSNATFDASMHNDLHYTTDIVYAVADRDLQHVKQFNIVISLQTSAVTVEVECRFRDGNWTASFDPSDELWECVCDCDIWMRSVPRPQERVRMVHFDSEIHQQEYIPRSRTLNPEVGAGFTAEDMRLTISTVRSMILHSPLRGWTTL